MSVAASSQTASITTPTSTAQTPLLIDTNIWIGLENEEISRQAVLGAVEPFEMVTSPIVLGELKVGVELARSALVRESRRLALDIVLKHRVLEQSIEVALRYGIIAAHVRQQGAVRQRTNDLWLAAAALVHKAAILTMNPRDFADVPGLQVQGVQRVARRVEQPGSQ